MTDPRPYPTITLGELRAHLEGYPDEWTIDFCGLDFYRIKQRGPTHVQCEFNQPVYLDQHTGRVIIGNLPD